MSNLTITDNRIQAMSIDAIAKVRALELSVIGLPQEDVATNHVIHGGMYSRTIKIKAGVMLTGAMINVATMLIVNGDVSVFANDEVFELSGYNVLPASAHRKQAFVAHTDTDLTMIFKTQATNVGDAEDEFTDESHLLMSRQADAKNLITITGE